jgi:hypothetical protein
MQENWNIEMVTAVIPLLKRSPTLFWSPRARLWPFGENSRGSLLVASYECFEGDLASLDRAILVDGRSTWEVVTIKEPMS